jgi:PmbA protein
MMKDLSNPDRSATPAETTKGSLDQLATGMDRLAAMGLEMAAALGADAAKISTSASFQKRLVVENKQFSLANSLESRGIGLLVHKDQKKGSASFNTMTEAALKQAVTDALALARYSVPDEALTLASQDEAPVANVLPFMFDAALAEVQLDRLQGVMAEILARLVRDKRVALDRFEMSADVSFHGLSNSLGMRQSERQTMASWSFFGMGRDGEEVTGFDYDGSFSFDEATLLAKGMEDASAFVAKILGLLKPRQCPSYKGAVLFSPRAVQEILLGMILYHAGGRQVMDGKSRWDKAIGTKVLSDKLTLLDDPHDPRFSGATAFDGDGVPTRRRTIIDRGTLNLHLHDCYSAKRTGTKTTATAGGPFALQVAAGATPYADVVKSYDNLLLIDRFSGNSDPVVGDFSGVAKSSRLLVKGEDQGAVTETMIAGNFFEMAQKILAVTDKALLIGGGFMAPYILIDGLSVTGS